MESIRRSAPSSDRATSTSTTSQIETIELIDSSDEEEEVERKKESNEKSRIESDEAEMNMNGDIDMAEPDEKRLFGKSAFRSSTKLNALIEYMRFIQEKDPLVKAVIFSYVPALF